MTIAAFSYIHIYMKYKVDLKYGYIIYDEVDFDKAIELYEKEGLRILKSKYEGSLTEWVLMYGQPEYEDISNVFKN